MAARIIVEATDVWEYFEEHEEELRDRAKMIAENQEYGVEIFLGESEGLPLVAVNMDSERCDESILVSSRHCYHIVKTFYEDYLDCNIIDFEKNELEMIEEREEEIDEAVHTLLDTLAPGVFDIATNLGEVVTDFKDRICEYLYRKYDISVYRPMYLECEEGTEEFLEYPYPEMELEGDFR